MKDNTYIKLFRRFQEWEWYNDPITKSVFIELLLRAKWHPEDYRGIRLVEGQCPVGRKEIASKLGISEQNVRTALRRLQLTNEITTKSTRNFTIVTIEKWEFWQVEEGLGNQQTNQQTNRQLTTNKEYKNTSTTTSKEPNIPAYEDICKYIEEKGLVIDADVFYTYFEGRNWYDKLNKPVLNWKLKCLQWNKDEIKRRNNNDNRGTTTRSESGKTKYGVHTGSNPRKDSRTDSEAQRIREYTEAIERRYNDPDPFGLHTGDK